MDAPGVLLLSPVVFTIWVLLCVCIIWLRVGSTGEVDSVPRYKEKWNN